MRVGDDDAIAFEKQTKFYDNDNNQDENYDADDSENKGDEI